MDRATWNQRYAETDLVWTAEPNGFLVDEASGLPPGRALDLACGEGRNAIWLAKQGWDVTAVDFAGAALSKGQRLAERAGVAGRVIWVESDLTVWLPPRAPFDLVAVLYLHVAPRVRRIIASRAVDALAPGGTLLWVGHDLANLEGGVGGPQNPDVLYTAPQVVDELRAGALAGGAALEVERAETVERTVASDAGERVALDAFVRLRRRPA